MTTDDTPLVATRMPSPVGELTVVASPRGLRAVLWPDEPEGRVRFPTAPELVDTPTNPFLVTAVAQLEDYFARSRQHFDITLDIVGTDFQQRVWRSLGTIGFGETRSYGEQAALLGSPNSARAVGAANGKNPLSVVLPCHRVVASSGNLTGFAGGLETKRWLLDFEQGARQGTLC
jgi:methylated-DNA-[protein]-cysteine S-methyltransferase